MKPFDLTHFSTQRRSIPMVPRCQQTFRILVVVACLLSIKARAFADDYAVIVGADGYSNLRPLEYSGKDAVALRERMIESGFPEKNVYCLFDKAKQNRHRPFREMIKQHVELIASNAEEDDLLFVWFSGHGVHMAGKSYLCGVDSRLDNPQSMIEVDWVFEQLRKSQARRKILIVDACRNEVEPPGRRSGMSVRSSEILRTLDSPPQGLLVITSTSLGQYAVEDENLGHGVFAHFVLEALSGKGDRTGDGRLTWRELFDYSARKTRDYVARTHLTAQRPKVSRAEELSDEDFVITTSGRASTTQTFRPNTSRSVAEDTSVIPIPELEQMAFNATQTIQPPMIKSRTLANELRSQAERVAGGARPTPWGNADWLLDSEIGTYLNKFEVPKSKERERTAVIEICTSVAMGIDRAVKPQVQNAYSRLELLTRQAATQCQFSAALRSAVSTDLRRLISSFEESLTTHGRFSWKTKEAKETKQTILSDFRSSSDPETEDLWSLMEPHLSVLGDSGLLLSDSIPDLLRALRAMQSGLAY